jgi:hypothetical protein
MSTFEWPIEVGNSQGEDYDEMVLVLVDTGSSLPLCRESCWNAWGCSR